jgi:hypothetical protein
MPFLSLFSTHHKGARTRLSIATPKGETPSVAVERRRARFFHWMPEGDTNISEVNGMRRNRWFRVLSLRAAIVLVAASSLGCFAYSRGEVDWDNTPVVNTGAGATIIYPGQTAPTYTAPSGSAGAPPPGSAPPAYGTPVQAPPSGPPPATATPMQAGGAPPSYGSAPTVTSGPNGEQYSGSPAPV